MSEQVLIDLPEILTVLTSSADSNYGLYSKIQLTIDLGDEKEALTIPATGIDSYKCGPGNKQRYIHLKILDKDYSGLIRIADGSGDLHIKKPMGNY